VATLPTVRGHLPVGLTDRLVVTESSLP